MGYEIIVIDNHAQNHFKQVHQHIHQRIPTKFEHPVLEKVWRNKIGHHDFLYHAHVKTGHLGNFHHWTILWEVKTHHGVEHSRLIDVHEGHKTFF